MACTLNTTLETIILKLFLFRMHRIWIVDERFIFYSKKFIFLFL